jgi:hypothetical protein
MKLVAVEVLHDFGFVLRWFWLWFLNISRGAGGGTWNRAGNVRALANFLAFPAGCTDILRSATGIATQYGSTRQKQQEDRCSEHGFSLKAILYGEWNLEASVERRKKRRKDYPRTGRDLAGPIFRPGN